jgi:iron complex transport system permease protein
MTKCPRVSGALKSLTLTAYEKCATCLGTSSEGEEFDLATDIIMKQNTVSVYREYTRRKVLVITAVSVAVLVLAIISMTLGSAKISPLDVLKALVGYGDQRTTQIVINIRLPRVLASMVAGMGLSLAGCIMQNVLRNPLASDYTLGVSQGAAFGAALAIMALGAGSVNAASADKDALIITNPYIVTLSAFSGAMLATTTILLLSRYRGITPEVMVLAGVAIGSLFSAGTVITQYFATDVQVASIVFWTFGDIGRASWQDLGIMTAVTIPAMIFFLLKRWDYNTLSGGDDIARSLGVNVGRIRMVGMFLASLVTATNVAFLGILAFVGLVAPHLIRRVMGSDYRYLIPASAFAGALLLLISDTFSRTVMAPVVLPVGAITSVMGAPLFIYLLVRSYGKSLFRRM